MPRPAAPGGAHPLSWQRDFQLLRVAVRVTGDDAAVAREIEFLAQDARQPVTARASTSFAVRRDGDGFAVSHDGFTVDTERHPAAVMDRVYRRAHAFAFAALDGEVLLRTAVGAVGGCRFLLVGTPGAGLSALAVRLLQKHGAAMEGDGVAFLRDGVVTTFPRAFHLRSGIERALPDLAAQLDDLPRIEGYTGQRIWAWHPDRAGFPWELRAAPVDAVVVVEANHGGDTRLGELARYETARHVVASASVPSGSAGAWLGEITRLVDRATCRRLTLGDVDRGATALVEELGGP